jgi:ATP-dependent protease Clp ATPase subunit
MFEVPSSDTIEKVIVTKGSVLDGEQPAMIERRAEKSA